MLAINYAALGFNMKNLLLKVVSVFIILITFLLLFFGLTKGVSYFVSKNASEKSKSEDHKRGYKYKHYST